MAIELEKLLFSVDTTALKETLDKLDAISNSVNKLANSTDKLNKVTEDEVKAKKKKVEATKEAVKAEQELEKSAQKSTSVLEKQQDILEFMSQGFSKGQSSTLAQAKAMGQLTSETENLLKETLQFQRVLQGGSPFDKSMSGMVALKNQIKELQEAMYEYNAGTGLTRDQTRDLARDIERIKIQHQQQGKAISETTAEIERYRNAYVSQAKVLNDMAIQEKTLERAQKDKLTAIRAVQSAEERSRATLDALNMETAEGTKLNERAALAVAAYERNLRLAGVSAEDAAQKLKVFKDQQSKITEATSRNQMNYLARGIGVQMGDIGVSLAGGMNPLLVAVQQGSQVQQLIQMANVDAKDMQKVMGESVRQMVESFKLMGVAVGSFVMGGLRSFVEVISEATSASKTFAAMSFYVAEAYGESSTMFSALQGFGKLINSLALAIIGFGTALAVGLVTSIVQTSKAMDTLNESLVLNGALLGATNKELGDLSRVYGSAAASSNDLKLFYAELAKAGFTSKEQLDKVTESSIKLSKYSSLSLEEIAKAYGDLAKDPVKALEKLAIETGLVNAQTIDNIRELKEQGKAFEANKAAIDAMQNAHSKAADTIKEELSAIGLLGKEMAGVWNSIGTAMERVANSKSSKELTSVLSLGSAVIGASISKLGATDAEKKKIDEELEKTVKLIEQTRDGVKGLSSEETERRKAQAEQAKFSKEFHDTEMKGIKKELEETKALTKTKADYIQEGFKKFSEKAKQAGYVTSLAEEQAKVKELSKAWDDANKVTKDKNNADTEAKRLRESFIRDQESLNKIRAEAEGKVLLLTKAEMKLLEIQRNPDWNKRTEAQKELLKSLAESAKQAELFANTLKSTEDTFKSWNQITKELQTQSVELDRAAESINNEYKLLGLTGVEREKASREIEYQNDLLKAQANYQKNVLNAQANFWKRADDISKEVLSPEERAYQFELNAQMYEKTMRDAETLLNKERETAGSKTNLKVAESYYKEMQRVSDMLADVLITALTEGGKAGSKKLGDYIKKELLSASSMFISSIIRAQLGNFMQSAFGINATNYAGGTLAGNLVGTPPGSLLGSAITGVGNLAGSTGLASFGAGMGLSSAEAAAASAAYSSAGMGTVASSLQAGSMLGAAMPWISGGLMVASLLGGDLFGSGGAPKSMVGGGGSISSGIASFNPSGMRNWTDYTSQDKSLATSIISDQLVTAIKKINSSYTGGAFLKGELNIKGKSSNQMLAQAVGSTGSPIYEFFQEAGKGVEDFNKFVKDQLPKLQLSLIVDAMRSSGESYKAVANSIVGDSENLTETLNTFTEEGIKQLTDHLVGSLAVLEKYNLLFKSVGKTLDANVFNSLVKIAGSLSDFSKALDGYYENFFTQAEKEVNTREAITKELDKVNLKLPTTREEFKKLAQSLDVNTESGQKAFIAMLQVQDAFASITPSFEDLAKQAEEAKKKQEDAVEDAYKLLEKAVDKEKDLVKERIKTIEDQITSFKKLVETIRDGILKVSATSKELSLLQADTARSTIRTAISSGVLPEQEVLSKSIDSVSKQLSDGYYASKEDQERATRLFVNELTDLQFIAGDNLDSVERQLIVEQKQLTNLEQTLVEQRKIVDAALGINTSVLSVAEAISGLQLAIMALGNLQNQIKTPVKQQQGNTGATVNQLYQSILGRAPDQGGADYWSNMINSGTSVQDVANAIKASPEAQINQMYESVLGRAPDAAGMAYWNNLISSGVAVDANTIRDAAIAAGEVPKFAEGGFTGYGGKYQPAGIVHKGEFVFNQEDVNNLGGPGAMQSIRQGNFPSDNSSLESRVDALVQAVEMLRYEARATAVNTSKMAKQLDRSSDQGDTLRVTVVT